MDKKSWSVKDKIKLYNFYLTNGPKWSDLSREFPGRSPESLRSAFNKTEWEKLIKENKNENISMKDPEEIKSEAQELIDERTKRIIESSEKRKMNEHLNKIARSEIVYDKIVSAITQVPPIKPEKIPIGNYRKKSTKPQEAFMVISDAHVGLAVVPEEVGGIGNYNVETFKERLMNYLNSVLRIIELHRSNHKIETLHIAFLGDLVHGQNNVGQWGFLHTEQNIMDQVFNACSEFTSLIVKLSQCFKKIKVHCVYGNHGRTAKRGVEKDFVNWDYLIYKWLEGSLSAYSNVEFNIPRSPFQIVEVMGHKFLLTHGSNVRSWSGIPWYGLQRMESRYRSLMDGSKSIDKMWKIMDEKGISASSKEACEFVFNYVKSFDYMIIGHFHSMGEIETIAGGRMIMNSSFIGGDDYSINSLVTSSAPSQKFFGMNHKGKTWSYDINLIR